MDQQSDLVAMGTSARTVLVYSIMQGDLASGQHLQDRELHQDQLLGEDQVSQLSLCRGRGRHSLPLLHPQPSSTPRRRRTLCTPWPREGWLLAMASRNIHFWDVSSKKVNKTVTGHANPVTRMEIAGNYLYSDLERVESLFWGRRLAV